jgi:competence protein ComGC
MVTKTAVDVSNAKLRRQVEATVRDLGCACAPDLAGQIGQGMKADDLIPVLESLVEDGVLRHKQREPDDNREYNGKYQIVYEPA